MEVAAGMPAEGALVQAAACRMSYAQLFRVQRQGAVGYRVVNVESNACLELDTAGDRPRLRQQRCRDGAPEQSFEIEPATDGHVQIVNTRSSRCLGVRPTAAGESTAVEQLICNGTAAQLWLLSRTFFSSPHQIKVRHSGKCLEAPMGGVERTIVRQYPCSRTTAQLFRFESVAAGKFTLVNVGGNTCLDVPMSQLDDGVQLWQWPCNGTSAQWFRIEGVGEGHDRIVNVNSGKCLAIMDGAGADGVALEQRTCSSADNQKWAVAVVP
jgi:hypothetical protein